MPAGCTRRLWSDQPATGAVQVFWEERGRWRGKIVHSLTFEELEWSDAELRDTGGLVFPVVGFRHRLKDVARSEFDVGQPVRLVPKAHREDAYAIEVRDISGRHLAGYVPRDRREYDSQRRLHQAFKARTLLTAIVLADRAYVDDAGRERAQRGRFWVLAAPAIQVVQLPEPLTEEYKAFAKACTAAEGQRWPQRRQALLADVRKASSTLDEHFAYMAYMRAAYRLRDHHPEALQDAIEASERMIQLAPKAAAAFRMDYPDSDLPGHPGYKQLAIICERNRDYERALHLVREAREQGWSGDWNKREQRIRKKLV